MKKNILIGGAAGMGSAVTSHLIGKIFCQLGYFVFNYRDYPSLIRGGHNFNILTVSDEPVYSHEENYEVILALDQKTIDFHQANLVKGGLIINAEKFGPILEKLGGPKILENDILIGYLFRHFGVDKEIIFKIADDQFGEKSALIKKAIEEGYNATETKEKLVQREPGKYLISGNEAAGLGAVLSGADVYLAYPMTPATSVLHFLAKRQIENNMLAFQLESEIAVINAALGASFAGARVMVGTSGGGFALMTEALSLAGMAELPLVVYLSQRTAPSTGVPTYTAQSDLKFALNAGHGEFPKIVLAPGDAKETVQRTEEAFYLSAKYRAPVILLSDKHLGESDYSFDELEDSKVSSERFILQNPDQAYKSYEITKTGVSEKAVPGQDCLVRATSYEHDEYGYTKEEAEWSVKMNEERLRKMAAIELEVKKLNPIKVYGQGKKLIIGWGSTKGAILDSLSQLKDWRFLQISYLKPFPKEKVAEEIKKSSQVVLVENSLTGALADVITEQTGIFIKNKVLKYDARPFTVPYLVEKIKKIKK
ncbi:MAG: 2-oxoacid:acceptor oxidoreductase subunit alpha [Candidatus Nealsonbacteria bacterium]